MFKDPITIGPKITEGWHFVTLLSFECCLFMSTTLVFSRTSKLCQIQKLWDKLFSSARQNQAKNSTWLPWANSLFGVPFWNAEKLSFFSIGGKGFHPPYSPRNGVTRSCKKPARELGNGHCSASAQEPISSWPRPISRVVNSKRLLLLLAPFNPGAAVQTPRSGRARCQIVWCWNRIAIKHSSICQIHQVTSFMAQSYSLREFVPPGFVS